MPRQQEEGTVIIDHHPRNRQPQKHPEVGIVMMTMMMRKDRRKVDRRRDPQGKERDLKRMRRRKKPLGMNYGSPEH